MDSSETQNDHTHMPGHVHEHHHGHHHHHDRPMTASEAVNSLLVLGQVALNSGDFASAVQAYASALEIEPNETAYYSLATLRARGLGGPRDYLEAARLFHQAELMGNERAGKLCGKCLFDFVQDDFEAKQPADLYATLAVFVSRVYSEAADPKQEVNNGLSAVANAYLGKDAYPQAAKVLRAAAEFGNDGYAQYQLALLYNAGTGIQKNDLAALYWLDRAADNGAEEAALPERDGFLEALRQGLSSEQFHETMETLGDWCAQGTPDVPADPAKAARWRELAQR